MMICLLCMEDLSESRKKYFHIYSDVGKQWDVAKIISTHFWLCIEDEKHKENVICDGCWEALYSFHTFYLKVATSHNYLGNLDNRIDRDSCPNGLKPEKSHKDNDIKITSSDFFVTEVKVEMQELELLPAVEVIEESTVSNDSVERTSQSPEDNSIEYSNDNLEFVDNHIDINEEQDQEQENVNDKSSELCYEQDFKTEETDILNITKNINSMLVRCESRRRRRGRPRKHKESISESESSLRIKELPDQGIEKSNEEIENIVLEILPYKDKIEDVKYEENVELSENENEFISEAEFLTEKADTEDSMSSSEESDDSAESLKEPEMVYAQIPKKVVVKPKKYRKRQKTDSPIKRMTREEIEKKRAQQQEYDKTIEKFFEKFACPVCYLLVADFGSMKAHFRASHKDETGYMSCCGRKFHLRKTLAEHVLVHWNPEHFKCSICSKVFQDSRSLEIHNQFHVNPQQQRGKRMFQCDKCPKVFTTKAAFEYHNFSKHVPKSEFQFSCPECNKKLPTNRKLKDHIKYAHDPQSTVICDKCGKQMRNQSSLKKHHEIEHSDKPRPVPVPMQCEICGTWLRHAAGLKQHMKTIHEDTGGEHRCSICNKTSSNARALKRHIYHNHECERKFKCTMCEKAFKRPQDLREHTSTHTGEVLYTCPNCPMTFFSNANMYKHRQRLHKAEWESDRKKPRPPNIMGQAISATAAMKMKQAVGATSAFFASTKTKEEESLPKTNISIF